MRTVAPRGRWQAGRAAQGGQALIFGTFMLLAALAILYFLFNTGQLVREKTKLTVTADAVAYSGSVMQARLLNFDALTNRAMVANTVAIAQLVSYSSWVEYVRNMGITGAALLDPRHAWYWAPYYLAVDLGAGLDQSLNGSGALEGLALASDGIIRAVLVESQDTAHAAMILARQRVMDAVAQANYRDDGTVTVEVLPANRELTDFVSRYDGEDRTRIAEVVRAAADSDAFVRRRSWDGLPEITPCLGAAASGRYDHLERRGATALIGFDQWLSLDTLSAKSWTQRNIFDFACSRKGSAPIAGAGRDAGEFTSEGLGSEDFGGSLTDNGDSAVLGMTAWEPPWRYSGLPAFHDLSPGALAGEGGFDAADPRLRLAVRVKRSLKQTQTSEGRSAIAPTGRLNTFRGLPAGGDEMVAVGASEVFFSRPPDWKTNVYGQARFGSTDELGSLFNPYWQARLVSDAPALRMARALQGVRTP